MRRRTRQDSLRVTRAGARTAWPPLFRDGTTGGGSGVFSGDEDDEADEPGLETATTVGTEPIDRVMDRAAAASSRASATSAIRNDDDDSTSSSTKSFKLVMHSVWGALGLLWWATGSLLFKVAAKAYSLACAFIDDPNLSPVMVAVRGVLDVGMFGCKHLGPMSTTRAALVGHLSRIIVAVHPVLGLWQPLLPVCNVLPARYVLKLPAPGLVRPATRSTKNDRSKKVQRSS